ncbi:AbrB/MazE/SpoVT family DNA-binding domain-containing protein [Paenibacillus sp. 1A_MP2]|uniref:AbrB/MazE/SpoVT family DNA-binding domain-containing protein n=1 Tax=Paenibacillus sp. 1A_MP2 TaxID=3457495 RepID=UPI003FCDAF26
MNKSKHMGMVRNLDSLGRIVLPIELRRTLDVKTGDALDYFYEDSDEKIILRKYKRMECIFCESESDLAFFKNYFICASCLKEASGNSSEPGKNKSQKLVFSDQAVMAKFLQGAVGKNVRSKDMLQRLNNVMEEYPDATQKVWAELLGVSQGRVSQLVQKLKTKKSPGNLK